MNDNRWWESEWYREWLKLAKESNARSPKREGYWVCWVEDDGEIVYKYLKCEKKERR